MQIHEISPKLSSGKKRVGRGGKKGTYSGRGGKGQSARSGFSQRATFEGGKSTLIIRTKKNRGFNSLNDALQVVKLSAIEKAFSDGEIVEPKTLKEKGLIRFEDKGIKVLSNGEIAKKVQFKGVLISAPAKAKIEKAGGTIAEK